MDRPTFIKNDIDSGLNCVLQSRLNEFLSHSRQPESLVRTINGFSTHRQINMEFDRKKELQVPCACGLPQRSPLSPILFVIYEAAMSQYKPAKSRVTTTYVYDELMLLGAKTTKFATQAL